MFNVLPTMQSIQSKALASGFFHSVEIGEAKSAPAGHGMFARIWMESAQCVATTLTYPIELHTVVLRAYLPLLADTTFEDELRLDAAMNQLKRDMGGDFDLGSTVRNLDIAGQYSGGLESEALFLDLSGTQFRITDLTIPVIVDDISELVA